MDAAGILPTFQGCAIHDFWKSYLKYDCQHALCNAHLLRKLVFLHEQENQTWAKAMIDHLLAIKQAVANARVAQLQALPDTEKVFLIARYNRIVEEGYAENPRAEPPSGPKRRGRRKQTKALNLLDRFRDHSPSILAFLHNFAVPFDNNQSERDLRMMKVRQKISGTFRSLDTLRRIFLGNPFLPTPDSS
jgi:transposase